MALTLARRPKFIEEKGYSSAAFADGVIAGELERGQLIEDRSAAALQVVGLHIVKKRKWLSARGCSDSIAAHHRRSSSWRPTPYLGNEKGAAVLFSPHMWLDQPSHTPRLRSG